MGKEKKRLIQRADEALCYSKESGRDRYTFHREIVRPAEDR